MLLDMRMPALGGAATARAIGTQRLPSRATIRTRFAGAPPGSGEDS